MPQPDEFILTALWTPTGLLVAAFLGCGYELWRGWRARRSWRFRPQEFRYHRWSVEILNDKVAWFSCERCGAVAMRAEPGR